MNKKKTSLHWVPRKNGEDLYAGELKVACIDKIPFEGMQGFEVFHNLAQGLSKNFVKFVEKKTAKEYAENVFVQWLDKAGLTFK